MGIDPKLYKEPVEGAEETAPDTPVTLTQAQFAAAIGSAVAEGTAANKGPQKVTFGEYSRKAHSPFHPQGKAGIPKAARLYLQNGVQCPLDTTHDEEIRLLNRITHSGRYIDRLVEVVVNTDNAEETVDIRFNNKVEFAFELKGRARNFTEILRQVVAAQEAEDAELADRENSRPGRRPFGNSKASQQAREAAAVNG